MNNQSNSQQSKTVVDAYYQAGVEGRLREFAPYLHPDFTTTAPNYLPWGGFHQGAAFFRDEVLPNLPDILDFGRFSYDVFLAENDRVVALVNFGLTGSDAMIKISEHWTVKNGKQLRSGSPISSRRRFSTASASRTASNAEAATCYRPEQTQGP
jgi:ketosteroid isomerase-like protein